MIARRLLSAAAALVAALAASAGPQAVWLAPEHDFGAFDESLGIVSCTFQAVNTGDEPLVVLNARANCGCTTPHYSDRPVMPGDTARITVGFDASGRPGRFSKNVVVTTNAKPAKTTLTVKGTVIGTSNTLRGRYPVDAGAMKLRTDELAYGEVSRARTGGQYIEAYNSLNDTLRPRVLKKPDYISVTISPAAVPPGENFVVSTVFDPVSCGQWDIVTDTLTLEAAGREVVLTSVAIVREDFSHLTPAELDRAPIVEAAPATLDFGRIAPAQKKPLSLTLRLANKGREPMKIRRIYCPDAAVDVTMKKRQVKPGKSERITVSVRPDKLAGAKMLNARLIIITNDPANPRTAVRLVGEVVKE